MTTYCPYCMHLVPYGQNCPNCNKDPSSYTPSSHHFPIGHLLKERYLVGRVLGEGGFGITYLGLDTTLERRVAIKEYFPNVFVHRETSVSLDVTCYEGGKRTLYEKGRDQFLQEARVMARFDHLPEVTQVLDFFPANNTAYIVMEYLSGNTLRTLLKQQGRVPAKYLFSMLEPVLQALNKVHGAGIIHRDISPDNIMILDSGQLKLMDFGCARDSDAEHTMTVMLKHGYAPSEQYTGYNQGPWTDVYAICATCYHCLTGRTPPQALERMSGQDSLIPPNRLGATLTPEQEQALLRGLAVEPKNRWQSISGLYAALYDTVLPNFPWNSEHTEVLDDGPMDPQTVIGTEIKTDPGPVKKDNPSDNPPPQPSRKNKALWIGAATCLAIVLAIGLFSLLGRDNKNNSTTPTDNLDTDGIVTAEDDVSEQDTNALHVAMQRKTITAGENFTVALRTDGTVVATGDNSYGQCNVKDWTDIIAIDAGTAHTVGLKSDGTLVAVGSDSWGKLNVENATNIVAIATGGGHTVALREDGTVGACGYNAEGQCDTDAWTNIVAIAAGSDHTVGLKADGTVVATGGNTYGQCDIEDWTDIREIWCGDYTSVGLKMDGTLVVAGGDSGMADTLIGWTDIVALSMGTFRTIGLKSDGSVIATGTSGSYLCDVANTWADIVAIDSSNSHIVGLKSDGSVVAVGDFREATADWVDIESVSGSWGHIAGLKSDGTVVAVGHDDRPECAVGSWSGIVDISAGNSHTVGLKSDGTIVTAKDLYFSYDNYYAEDWTDIVSISTNESHMVGLRSDGTVIAAGDNDYGQCNVNDWTDIIAVSAGTDHTIGLHSDGTVVAAGDNDEGQSNVGGWTDIIAVSAGCGHTVGLRSDGTVIAVGNGYYYSGIDGTVIEPGNAYYNGIEKWTDIIAVSVEDQRTVGLKSDGTVVICGVSMDNNPRYFESIFDWTDITSIFAGNGFVYGVRKDGTVVTADTNDYGQCAVEDWVDIMTVTREQPALDDCPSDLSTPDKSEIETFSVVFDPESNDYYFYPRLTQGQRDKIYNLSANELPREIADLSSLRRNQIWDDLLIPLAGDENADVTLYGVVNAGWLSEATVQGDEEFGNVSDMDENMVVLRYGDKIITQDMSWNRNAWNEKNPWVAVDDFDGDGSNEVAVCTYAVSGTGTSYDELWIYDPGEEKSYRPDFSNLDLMVEADWINGKATLVAGRYSAITTVDESVKEDKRLHILSYGTIIKYTYDKYTSAVECTTAVAWGEADGCWQCADVTAPIICADGGYKLGDVSRISLYE